LSRVVLILALALLAVAAAPARGWDETPYRSLLGGSPASCLRAAGDEGRLGTLGPGQARATPVDALAAGRGRPGVRERVRFPAATVGCPGLREQAGAGVVAAPARDAGGRVEMRAAAHDRGAHFAAPVAIGATAALPDASYDVAVSPRGDAVVAWVQVSGDNARVVAARRAPGGGFGRMEALTPLAADDEAGADWDVAAGIDGAGRATVAWAGPATGDQPQVGAASAEPGAAWGAPQLLTPSSEGVGRLSLAVAADGGALLAHDGATGGGPAVHLFERAPGATAFGPERILGDAQAGALSGPSGPALALGDGGAAVVAWREDGQGGAVRTITRAAGGAFTAPRTIEPERVPNADLITIPTLGDPPAPSEEADLGLHVALSSAGRIALAWTARRDLPDAPRATVAAAGTLDGSFGPASVLGSPVRASGGVSAFLLRGGEPAVAWTDNVAAPSGFGDGGIEPAAGGGRIHVARADAAPRTPKPPPAAHLRAAPLQRRAQDQPIRVVVDCVAACDVRAYVPDRGGVAAGAAASLRGGRSRVLRLARTAAGRLPRSGRVTVQVRVAAPGSRIARALRIRVRLAPGAAQRRTRRRPAPPRAPRILGARAVRRGGSIRVTWHTAVRARGVTFSVRPQRGAARPDLGNAVRLAGRGNTRFFAILHPLEPAALRRVTITALRRNGTQRSVTVSVS
jgi:hypothetical protein